MLNGRTEAAEKSKDEIQKLISEIAHQMRTPLANIRTYQELLEEEWSKTGTKTDENVDNYLKCDEIRRTTTGIPDRRIREDVQT